MQAAITAGAGSGIVKLKNSIPTGRENAIKTRKSSGSQQTKERRSR